MDGFVADVICPSYQSLKIPVINTENYRVFFQLLSVNGFQVMFVHCDVFKWSKEIAQKLKYDFNTLHDLYGGPVFALNEIGDEKHRKFLSLYDFKFIQEVIDDEGKPRNLYIRIQGQ